ncbi:MAG: flagellar biosynthesis protein FlhB [Bdellovibrio sp.]|nr:MAG: flagellar biosynthesis protein FlhB [Bdellovibrio sp.]
MAEEGQGERTEEATQSRREEFRRKGQVAQTRELSTALLLLLVAGAVYGLSQFFLRELFELLHSSFGEGLVAAVRQGDLALASRVAGEKLGILLLPAMGILLLIGVGSTVIQTGFLQVENAISLDMERIDPIEGLRKLISLRNGVEALKSVIKIILISLICYAILRHELARIPYLSQLGIGELGTFLANLTGRLFAFIGVFILVLALGDYFFQRWSLERRMMMTKQEVREENRSREGDPLIKARIRKVQREVANRRMMQKVPEASVVITNPTHIAVALKYDANLPAPQLIAKGADLVAEKIKQIAAEYSIPIVENKPLARTIFKTMKLGQVIPRELYVAVAEVLSYVFKLKRKSRKT